MDPLRIKAAPTIKSANGHMTTAPAPTNSAPI